MIVEWDVKSATLLQACTWPLCRRLSAQGKHMDWKHLKSATSPPGPVTLAQSESVMQAGKALMSLLGKVKSVLEVPMLPCPATRVAKRERTNRREPSIVTFFTMCSICLVEGVFTRLWPLVRRVLHSFESYHHTLSALVDKDLFGKAPFTFKTKVDYKVRSELSLVAGRNSDCQLLETREPAWRPNQTSESASHLLSHCSSRWGFTSLGSIFLSKRLFSALTGSFIIIGNYAGKWASRHANTCRNLDLSWRTWKLFCHCPISIFSSRLRPVRW